MQTVLIVLAAMVALEGLIFVAAPESAKKLVEALSPGELRLAGLLECAVAAAAIYFAVAG